MKKSKQAPQNPAHAAEMEVAERSEQQLAQYVEESPESRRARLREAEKAEDAERAKQIAKNVGTVNPNGPFVVRDGELWRKPITSPPSPAPPKAPTPDAMTSTAVRPEANAGKLLNDPWATAPHLTEYAAPVAPPAQPPKQPVRKASQPAEQRPAAGQRYSDLLQERDSASAQAAALAVRPTPAEPDEYSMDCPVCGDRISKATAFHTRENGKRCIIDKAFALREGIVA